MVKTDIDENTRIIAYVDEAGSRGYVRDLISDRDREFSLIVAVVFDPDCHDKAVKRLQVEFDRFAAAAPSGAKLHITDAFKPGNEAWAVTAAEVRRRYVEILLELRPCILYGARRFKLAREAHERTESIKASALTSRRSPVKIVGSNRPSDSKVEDDAFLSLILRIDCFGELVEQAITNPKIDLFFDQTDKSEAERFAAIIRRTETIGSDVKTVKGFDHRIKQSVEGSISMSFTGSDFRLETKYVGEIAVVGKNNPMVLAADIVANYLHKHLSGLGDDAPLHRPSSVASWELGERVWGVSDEANDDLF